MSHEVRMLERSGTDIEGIVIGSFTPHGDSPNRADYRTALSRQVPRATRAGVAYQEEM